MILRTMYDLKNAGVDIITLGQYLRPTKYQMDVKEYLHPEHFAYYKRKAQDMGFLLVVSGPLVRSSYMPIASTLILPTTRIGSEIQGNKTTFPELPDFMASNPSSNSSSFIL